MIDKETLLKSALPETEVDIPGRGTVRVRALTRAEALRLQHADIVEADALAIHHGLIEPPVTLDEAREVVAGWGATEIQPLVTAVMALSGLVEGAQKSDGEGTDDRGGGPVPVPARP